MKRPAPDERDSDDTWHCNRCDVTKPVGKFAKWAIRNHQHLCRSCATVRNREARALRKGSLHRVLIARLRKHMHRDGYSRSDTMKLRLSHMEEVATLQGGRSIFSGIADSDRLTVGRWNGALPWSFANLVILTHAEHREHKRRDLSHYHTAYVGHVEANLLKGDTRGVDREPALVPEACPPKSLHKRGMTTDVVCWYIRKFGVMHPLLHKGSDAARPNSVPRVGGRTVQTPRILHDAKNARALRKIK